MSSGKANRKKNDLSEAVQYFAKCKAKVVVKGNLELQTSLEIIKNASQKSGLEPFHFVPLLDAAASGFFAQTVSRQLIRALVPSSSIPQEAIVKAISWMSTNKPPIAIQCLLLRWILVVYDYIDGYDKLHALYGIIFLFLDSQVMMFFGLYDRKWKSEVRTMMEKSSSESRTLASLGTSGPTRTEDLCVSKSHQLGVKPPPKKKQRLSIPIAHSASAEIQQTEHTDQVSLCVNCNRVPFVQIDTFTSMLDNINKIEFPSQVAACLQNPVLQHLMAYSADKVVAARFNFWLQHTLTEEFLNNAPLRMEDNEMLLKKLVDFTDFLQEGIPVVENFLSSYLLTWNGLDYCPLIFRLISRCHLYGFQDLNDLILEPLRQLYFSSSVYFKCQCLFALTELLRNYAANECPRLQEQLGMISSEDQTTTETQLQPMISLCGIFPDQVNVTVQPLSVLQRLVAYVDHLAVLGLLLEENNSLLMYSAINFIELLADWNLRLKVEAVTLPSEHLVRRILFSSSSVAISSLCMVFCRYKEAFVQTPSRKRESVNMFNDMLVDICDALWRNKAFSNQTQGSLRNMGSELAPSFQTCSISYPTSRFSIFQGQAFLPYAWKFLVLTQPKGKKVHPNQLKTVKDTYLDFLEQEHLRGIIQFIGTFVMRKTTSSRTTESLQEGSVQHS
ncbi:hypothetical protein C0Q70_20863 [Pomacea canaliculata]|uniref:Centromere protein I n=1 Tax=Pomacea canaliculata TaxID=400727 RepID=A0A2T7NAW2_POMCA|nr:hypothetical protein C0Q70_20863 [Pomacea canaliculata]